MGKHEKRVYLEAIRKRYRRAKRERSACKAYLPILTTDTDCIRRVLIEASRKAKGLQFKPATQFDG